jgi:hypothetical protein
MWSDLGQQIKKCAVTLTSGHIFTIGFSCGNERGSKKDKKWQKRQKALYFRLFAFFILLVFFASLSNSLLDRTL